MHQRYRKLSCAIFLHSSRQYDLTFFFTDCHKKIDCFLISDYMIATNESRLLFEKFNIWHVFLRQNKTGEAVSIAVGSLLKQK